MKNFLFSFVIPAWNVQRYLTEAVQSVLAQSVGFEDNIQLVLVNDGSTDATGAICAYYQKRYPNNVIFIDRPHSGVSAARNAGMRAAVGRYLNFLDADDRWDPNACAAALAFFSKYPEVNIACFPMVFFGRRTGNHWLNYKFGRTRKANIFIDHEYLINSSCSCFIKSNVAKRHTFDTRLSFGEDTLWMAKHILDEQEFAVIVEQKYRYRKRQLQNSAVDIAKSNLKYFSDTPRFCLPALLDYARTKYSYVPSWAQFAVMLELTWRLKEQNSGLLNSTQRHEYRNLVRSCLVQIDDQVILTVRNIHEDERLFALSLKYDLPYEQVTTWVKREGAKLWLSRPGAPPLSFAQVPRTLRVEFMDITGGQLILRGSYAVLVPAKQVGLVVTMALPDGGVREYPCALCRRPDLKTRPLLGDELWARVGFELSLPLVDGAVIRAFGVVCSERFELKWSHAKLSPFVRGYATSYLARGGHVVGNLPDSLGLFIERAGFLRLMRLECAFVRQIGAQLGLRRAMKAACVRLAVRTLRRLSGRRPVWLISDRITLAGDNGEAFFEYLMARPETRRTVRPVFALSRHSADWSRLKQLGPTVAHGSALHKMLFLVAGKIISSHADISTTNPFNSGDRGYRDLFNFDFVFLQHGVTVHDLSAWLCRAEKNIALFVTTAARERQAIMQGNYDYGAEQVMLTGFPRHDGLLRRAARERPQGLVAVMPTWRKSLVAARDPQTTLSVPNPAFVQSEYFRFWNGLIQHPRLLAALRRHGYRLRFVIHPQFTHEADKFEAREPASVLFRYDYRQTFCEAALLVTDYSSVALDFALLKKPVIYAQFDRDVFYAGQIYGKSYFDFDRDGFGPVCATLEDTVDAVIRFLDKDCGMDALYRDRVDAFFGPQPENRCQAVLEAIEGLGRRPL